jgi:hypothetical protein
LTRGPRRVGLAAAALAVAAPALVAQGYRLRLDARAQGVSYRGWAIDSIPVADTVTGPGGGPATPDGFAVRCGVAVGYCFFFRPGPERRGGPLTTTADLSLWGLGIRGLRVRAVARLGVDLSDPDAWPGTEPALQLLEGHAEYAVERITARLGRLALPTRFGLTGLDGADVALRDPRCGWDVMGYAGWGLARATALPVTSPVLNPLDDFQPRDRQLVAGLGAGWTTSRADVRVSYQREVDPTPDYFVSERAGIDAGVRPFPGWTLVGGAEYDLAAGWWGSAEATLGYAPPGQTLAAALGIRRYRPHFDLWSVWLAFSPVPYSAVHGSLAFTALTKLRLRVRGERYWFADDGAETPLVDTEDAGWRFASGVTYLPSARWTIDGGYRAEFGPGASSRGFDGSVRYDPGGALTVAVRGGTLDRPLEMRFDDASLHWYGFDAEFRPSERLRLQLGAARYAEERDRPDAAAFDWSQVRLSARVVLLFQNGGDLGSLPRAVPRAAAPEPAR